MPWGLAAAAVGAGASYLGAKKQAKVAGPEHPPFVQNKHVLSPEAFLPGGQTETQ